MRNGLHDPGAPVPGIGTEPLAGEEISCKTKIKRLTAKRKGIGSDGQHMLGQPAGSMGRASGLARDYRIADELRMP